MSNETFRFKIGRFECFAVSDGTLTYAPPCLSSPCYPSICQRAKKGS